MAIERSQVISVESVVGEHYRYGRFHTSGDVRCRGQRKFGLVISSKLPLPYSVEIGDHLLMDSRTIFSKFAQALADQRLNIVTIYRR